MWQRVRNGLLSVPANDAQEVLVLVALANLLRHLGVGGFPERQRAIKTGGCEVILAHMGRPIRLTHAYDMLSAWGFVFFARIQENLMSAIHHHAAKAKNLARIGAG